jgi:hypothetical protein
MSHVVQVLLLLEIVPSIHPTNSPPSYKGKDLYQPSEKKGIFSSQAFHVLYGQCN